MADPFLTLIYLVLHYTCVLVKVRGRKRQSTITNVTDDRWRPIVDLVLFLVYFFSWFNFCMADIQALLSALDVFSRAPDKTSIDRANSWLQDFQHSVNLSFAYRPSSRLNPSDRAYRISLS